MHKDPMIHAVMSVLDKIEGNDMDLDPLREELTKLMNDAPSSSGHHVFFLFAHQVNIECNRIHYAAPDERTKTVAAESELTD